MESEKLKRTLFGYSKDSVIEVISDFKITNQKLQDTITNQEMLIENLKDKLSRYESKDVLVSEVLVEAKHVAKNMVKDAHAEVSALRSQSEAELSEKKSHFDQTMSELEVIKSTIVNQESMLRDELKAIIQKYLQYVDNIDLSNFSELLSKTDENFKAVKVLAEENLLSNPDNSNTKIVKFHTKYKDIHEPLHDIPTYGFNEIMS